MFTFSSFHIVGYMMELHLFFSENATELLHCLFGAHREKLICFLVKHKLILINDNCSVMDLFSEYDATDLVDDWFMQHQKHCTRTDFDDPRNHKQPLLLKELSHLWDKSIPGLPWENGAYNKSNTLLVDANPFEALRNPVSSSTLSFVLISSNDIGVVLEH